MTTNTVSLACAVCGHRVWFHSHLSDAEIQAYPRARRWGPCTSKRCRGAIRALSTVVTFAINTTDRGACEARVRSILDQPKTTTGKP